MNGNGEAGWSDDDELMAILGNDMNGNGESDDEPDDESDDEPHYETDDKSDDGWYDEFDDDTTGEVVVENEVNLEELLVSKLEQAEANGEVVDLS